MKILETPYNGRLFRSRLEARWAMFFDLAGIKWQYEPDGFEQDGECYCPDFHLPDAFLRSGTKDGPGFCDGSDHVYFELKGTLKDLEANEGRMARFTDMPLVAFVGDPPGEGYQMTPTWDNNMEFMRCYRCGTVKIEFRESNYQVCPKCGEECRADHPVLVRAAERAVRARYERGKGLVV